MSIVAGIIVIKWLYCPGKTDNTEKVRASTEIRPPFPCLTGSYVLEISTILPWAQGEVRNTLLAQLPKFLSTKVGYGENEGQTHNLPISIDLAIFLLCMVLR